MERCKRGSWTHGLEGEHLKFEQHLASGGTVYRNDTLNDIQEHLTAAEMEKRHGCVCGIRNYGYANLTCVPDTPPHETE